MKTTPEIADERWNICITCERFNKHVKVCKECGCYMPVKTHIANSSCPLKKWDKAPPKILMQLKPDQT